jgi:hypothetical protein
LTSSRFSSSYHTFDLGPARECPTVKEDKPRTIGLAAKVVCRSENCHHGQVILFLGIILGGAREKGASDIVLAQHDS